MKINKKALLISVLVLIFIFSVFAVTVNLISKKKVFYNSESPLTNVNVSLKWFHQAQFAGLYVAQEQGLYANVGLDIDFEPFDYEKFPIDLVVSGQADFGVTGADELLLARSQGQPVVALAVIFQKNPVCAFSLASSSILTPLDMKGKRVGLQRGVNVEYIMKALFEYQYIDFEKDLEIIDVGFDITPLLENKIDVMTGYCTNEPLLAQKMGYEVNIIRPSDHGVSIYADVLFTSEQVIKDNLQKVANFVSASLAGWQQAFASDQDSRLAVENILKYKDFQRSDYQEEFDFEMAKLQASKNLIIPSQGFKIGDMDYVSWNAVYEFLKKNNLLKNDFDLTQSFTYKFLK